MNVNSQTPATKPQPVVVYGAVVAALVSIDGGLITLLHDNATAVLWLGIANVVLAGAAVFKDQLVKAQVVPYNDVVAYANDERQVVTGPAAAGPDGELVHDVLLEDGQPRHDGEVDNGDNEPVAEPF